MTHATFTWLVALLLLLAAPRRGGADEIKPPFNLRWGETAERMQRLLGGAKARIVARR